MPEPGRELIEEIACEWPDVLGTLVGLVGRHVEVEALRPGSPFPLLSCRGVLQPLELPQELMKTHRVTMLVGDRASFTLSERYLRSAHRTVHRYERIEELIEQLVVVEEGDLTLAIGDDWSRLWLGGGEP